jgi:hypothetical protein
MADYNIFEEREEDPFNLMVRVSIEGQDNFRKNYTENIELILSRSITHRGLTNSPGTTVSQRASTVASFLNQPSADTFSHLFIGFDLTRQIK